MNSTGEPEKPESGGRPTNATKLSPLGLGIGACVILGLIVLAATAPKVPIRKPEKTLVGERRAELSDFKQSLGVKPGSDADVAQTAETSRFQQTEISKQATQRSFDRLWTEVLRYTQPCENAQNRLANIFAQGNFSVEAYDAARRGQVTCLDSYQSLQSMASPDSLPSDAKQNVQTGLKACADAALARMTFMSKAASIIDGDRRPSNVSAAKAQSEAAQISTLQCVAGITDGATKAGATIGNE